MNRAILVAVAFLLGTVDRACADSIATRDDLENLLGGQGTIEDFSAYNIADGGADGLGLNELNAGTIVNGQGPGLVQPDLDFTFGSGGLQWDGKGYYGSPSKEILSGFLAGQPLTINFTSGAVTAFGVDLRAFTGFGATADMQVFALDGTTLIGEISGIALPNSGVPVFAGWYDPDGIGAVQLTQGGQPWSPIIANLEYGTVPCQ
jgi:hypothetical protein